MSAAPIAVEEHSILLIPSADPTRAARAGDRYPIGAAPLFGRNLRVALAMRGGVSLAVWIGGAVGELDLLRRIRWTSDGSCYFLWNPVGTAGVDDAVYARARVYANALRAKGYDCVEFDALAGASAGGLNSILYSVAQRVGARLDSVLGVWVTNGAFWRLMRGPGLTGLDSALDGDGFFAPGVLTALKNLYSDSSAQVVSHRARRLAVDISSTVIDTEDARDRSSSQGRAQFHFAGTDPTASPETIALKEHRRSVPAAAEIPVTADTIPEETVTDLARLAYSARATSSLPGGFEPALIYSSFNPPTAPEKRIDMSYAFHVHRDGFDSPYRAVDGGLTDNIPIDRAFRAIRSLATEVYSDRAIIYLDPAPPPLTLVRTPRDYNGNSANPQLRGTIGKRTDPSSRLLKVIARTLGIRVGKENAADKADAIDAFRRQLALSAGRSKSVAPLSGAAAAQSPYDNVSALSRYADYRASSDSNLLYEVLEDPAVWQLGTDLAERHSYGALTSFQLADLDENVRSAYRAMSATPDRLGNAIYSGPLAAIDTGLSLLSWVRALEEGNFRATGSTQLTDENGHPTSTIADIRRQLYDVIDRATRERDIVLQHVCLDVLQHDTVVNPIDPAFIAAYAVNGLTQRPSAATVALWPELDTLLDSIQALTNAPVSPIPGTKWAGLPAVGTTTPIEVAAFAAASGIPEAIAGIKYAEISAAAPVPDVTPFPRLRADDFRRTLRSILALDRPKDVSVDEVTRLTGTQPLSAYAKLNGTAIGAFAGFLSTDWRRNDWLWGRLDAASGMLGFLDSIDTPEAPWVVATTDVATSTTDAQDAILREAALTQISLADSPEPGDARQRHAPFSPLPKPTATPTELRQALVIGADALTDLNPGYRVAVASRAVHLAFRSFGRRKAGLWTLVITALARPLGVLLPIVVDPPRGLLILSILTGLWTVGSVQGTTNDSFATVFGPPHTPVDLAVSWGWWALPLIAIAILVFAVRSGSATGRRWSRIIAQLERAGSFPTEIGEVRRYRRSATAAGVILVLASAVLFALVLLANARGLVTWAATVSGLIVAAALAVFATLRFGAVPSPAGFAVRNGVLTAVAGILFVAVIAYPGALAKVADNAANSLGTLHLLGGSEEAVQHLPVIVTAVALLVSLICNWGWLAGVTPLVPLGARRLTVAALSVAEGLVWVAQAVIAAIVSYWACVAMLWFTDQPGSHLVRALCVVVALWISATVQWMLSQIPTWYVPSDGTRRPAS